jgi:hypothetical protein
MGRLRDWLGTLFGGDGRQAYDRAEEEQDFEPRVDIDAIRADEEAGRIAGETGPADAERLGDPDAP